MRKAPLFVFLGVPATAAVGSFLGGGENRLVNALLAVGIVGVAGLVAHTQRAITQGVWSIVAACSIVGGSTALVFHKSRQGVCTATDASGRRQVIGTDLTERGKKYKRANPADDNNKILRSLGGLPVELAWTSESIRHCQMALAVSGALWIPLFGVAAVAAASASSIGQAKVRIPPRAKPRAFLSYAHDDGATAARLKDRLNHDGIDVTLDTESMLPGERIPDFIDRSIRNCDAIVSLMSSRSLVSAWVASETLAGIARSTWSPNVVLISCYLDDEWLQADFRLRCTAQIDARLQQIGELLAEHSEKKIDAADLTDEQTRLFALRNNLGTILRMSKDSLCLDVRENQFEISASRLVGRIHQTFREYKSNQV